jgi:hypothetical protein
MPDFGEVIKGRAGAVTTNVDALSSAGLALRNAGGQNVALLGAGGGQGTTFYDGVNITGVLDQASATTLAIGTGNATAITLGKAGITTTVAGALTSSQLLTASLGLTITGGTAATEKIARTAADTLDINNGAIVTTATAITLAKATTVSAGAFNVSANTTHSVGTTATTLNIWRTRSGSQTQVDAAGGDAANYYGAFTLSTGTEQRWWLLSGKSFNVYGGGADTFNILNAALATNLSITQAGAVTIPTNTTHTFGNTTTAADTFVRVQAGDARKSGFEAICQDGYTWQMYGDDNDNGTWNLRYLEGPTIALKATRSGAVTVGPATNTPYTTFHTTNKNIFSSTPSAASDSNGAFLIGANAYSSAGWQPTRVTNLGGVVLFINTRTSDTTPAFEIKTNLAADAVDAASTTKFSITQAGAVTVGPASGLTSPHMIQNNSTTSGNYIASFKKLATNRETSGTLYVSFEGADATEGYIGNVGTTLTLVDASDERRKQNITDYSKGLQEILALRPVDFEWKGSGEAGYGFIAQEVRAVVPEAVSVIDESERGGFSDAHYVGIPLLIPAMVKAIQELSAKLDAANARIEKLENK